MSLNNLYKLDQVSIRLIHDRDRPLVSSYPLNSPDRVAKFLHDEIFGDLDRELFAVVNLKTDNSFAGMKILTTDNERGVQNMIPSSINICSIGTLNESHVHPREVLKSSILSNANAVFLIHNHPSGNLEPSKADFQVTDRLIKAYDLIGIPVLDHIILGPREQYYSFMAERILPFPNNHYAQNQSGLSFTGTLVAENGVQNQKQEQIVQNADSALFRLNAAKETAAHKRASQSIAETTRDKISQAQCL